MVGRDKVYESQMLGRHRAWLQPPVVDVAWMDVDLAFPEACALEGGCQGMLVCGASEGLQVLGRMALGPERTPLISIWMKAL